jgi:2-polyprenyl-3-methyl-5-hydroxy-6-metoxy-1,4-benzoquinol methylase
MVESQGKTMDRVAEPHELMLSTDQAQAYGTADLTRFNGTLLDAFQFHFASFSTGTVLDLGCGAADISIRFARTYPAAKVVGVDGSPAMLAFARECVKKSGLGAQIELRHGFLPGASLELGSYDAVVANSLLHHLWDPADLWRAISNCIRPGTAVMVVDLIRPNAPEQATKLVKEYAGRGHPVVQQDLYHSLCAAYTVEDTREQIRDADMGWIHVEAVSELQMKAWGVAQ